MDTLKAGTLFGANEAYMGALGTRHKHQPALATHRAQPSKLPLRLSNFHQ
jgi:hypothetical protein